jgi:hypothetical protein
VTVVEGLDGFARALSRLDSSGKEDHILFDSHSQILLPSLIKTVQCIE